MLNLDTIRIAARAIYARYRAPMLALSLIVGTILGATVAEAYTYSSLYSNARRLHQMLIEQGYLDNATGLVGTGGSISGTLTVAGVDGGTVVITSRDNDTNSDLAIRPGGDGGFTLGGATTPAITLSTDSTGDGEVVLPAGSIGASEETYAGRAQIVICGDQDTVNNNTIYYGPSVTLTATDTGGMDCDLTAAGNATEATADAPAFGAKAFQVRGMVCRSGDQNASVSYTLRSAAAATTPSVTCTIADNETDCVADIQTTTNIASGATVAIAAASTSNVGAVGGFACTIDIAY